MIFAAFREDMRGKYFFRLRNIAFTLLLALSPAAAIAADPTTPCDPEVMDAINSRAYLEAQREIVQNENLIFKPDSVLEYTCFDKFLGNVAKGDDNNFSEKNPLGTPSSISDPALDQALAPVVSAFSTYISTNYGHKYLNTRTDKDYETSGASATGTSYTCEQIRNVWMAAKCLNFGNVKDIDLFYDFPYYTNQMGEMRKRPYDTVEAACKAPDMFKDAITAAFNGKQDKFTLSDDKGASMPTSEKYKEDIIKTHLDKILPKGIAPATNCASPIPTGVKIVTTNDSKDEKICPNPGCTYNGSSCE